MSNSSKSQHAFDQRGLGLIFLPGTHLLTVAIRHFHFMYGFMYGFMYKFMYGFMYNFMYKFMYGFMYKFM